MTPKILLAAPCSRQPACAAFFDCFYALDLPDGSVRYRATGNDISANVNHIIEKAIEGDFTHLMLVDDDFLFPHDLCTHLLSHKLDAVSALVTQRLPPFRPYLFNHIDESGRLGFHDLTTETGLIKVYGVGGLPTLTSIEVLKKLPKPYFPFSTIIDGVSWESAIIFTKMLMELGIEIWVDLDWQIWHVGQYSVSARRVGDKWKHIVRIGDANIEIPF